MKLLVAFMASSRAFSISSLDVYLAPGGPVGLLGGVLLERAGCGRPPCAGL